LKQKEKLTNNKRTIKPVAELKHSAKLKARGENEEQRNEERREKPLHSWLRSFATDVVNQAISIPTVWIRT
jgi:hypothetical protein